MPVRSSSAGGIANTSDIEAQKEKASKRAPPLTIRLYRHAYIETRVTGSPRDHEYALQRVEVPFARFVAALPGLTPAAVRAVRFRFDRTTAGAIVLDDIGIESP